MSAKHDHEHERTEHKTSRLQPTHTRVGALPQSHLGLCGTLVDPGKDTHATPVPLRRKAVGGRTQAPRHDRRPKTTRQTRSNVLSGNRFWLTLGNLQNWHFGRGRLLRTTGGGVVFWVEKGDREIVPGADNFWIMSDSEAGLGRMME